MNEQNRFRTMLQAAIYLIEVAVLSGMLALAAGNSTEFALGPIARLAVAAALPLPCHLILVAHFVLSGRTFRPRSFTPVRTLQPQPLPA